MSLYAQSEDASNRAREILVSYDEYQQIVARKAEKLRTDAHTIMLEKIILKPGRREVILTLRFPDEEFYRAKVDIDRGLVLWIRNYLESES